MLSQRMDDRFVNLGEEVILTLFWQSGASESATVCFVISLSICYWLFKCRVLHAVFVCVLACVREGDTVTQPRLVCKLIRASSLCLSPLILSWTWTDGKTKDIINCLYIYFESWSSRLSKGALHFRLLLAVFGQSQCTVPVGQSEQTALVGRRDFVEKEAFERGGA